MLKRIDLHIWRPRVRDPNKHIRMNRLPYSFREPKIPYDLLDYTWATYDECLAFEWHWVNKKFNQYTYSKWRYKYDRKNCINDLQKKSSFIKGVIKKKKYSEYFYKRTLYTDQWTRRRRKSPRKKRQFDFCTCTEEDLIEQWDNYDYTAEVTGIFEDDDYWFDFFDWIWDTYPPGWDPDERELWDEYDEDPCMDWDDEYHGVFLTKDTVRIIFYGGLFFMIFC